jgi:hypothetical protein
MANPCEQCLQDLEETEKEKNAICRQLSIELEGLARLPLQHETNMILLGKMRARHPQDSAEEFMNKMETLQHCMAMQDERDILTVLSDYHDVMRRQCHVFAQVEMCKYFGHEMVTDCL